ncbi:MAG TPA: ATP-binding cassette domain-containing protein [Candidatus Saccharimonadales bacterium]|nr:ATP-binding cassette domain-containing protein [Candidatus Saccharimonadales bacterium]
MIKAQHLSKKYRKKQAVSDLSFEVHPGRVTGFLGPNGAGKSTTMRLMLGLDNGGGNTTFDDKPLHGWAEPSKMVGVLLEAKAFHPTRTSRQHLKILAEAGNIPMARVDEVLDMVGLKDVAKKGPGKFSLGMSQRLGIAAAILGKPKYLMLDEPANGLDPEGVAWLRQFLKDYAAEGNGVFVSSHLLSEMQLMADDVVVIGRGTLIADTSMKDLLAQSTHSGVFVRTEGLAKLKTLLKERGLKFETLDAGLKIDTGNTDEIGKLAFTAGVPVLELSTHSASLEEAFLEITAGSEEYVGTTTTQKKRLGRKK